MASDFATLVGLRARAAAQVAAYPQYAGHFDATILAVARRDVLTKMGRAISQGEHVLLFPGTKQVDGRSFVDVWSMNNGCKTSVPIAAVRAI